MTLPNEGAPAFTYALQFGEIRVEFGAPSLHDLHALLPEHLMPSAVRPLPEDAETLTESEPSYGPPFTIRVDDIEVTLPDEGVPRTVATPITDTAARASFIDAAAILQAKHIMGDPGAASVLESMAAEHPDIPTTNLMLPAMVQEVVSERDRLLVEKADLLDELKAYKERIAAMRGPESPRSGQRSALEVERDVLLAEWSEAYGELKAAKRRLAELMGAASPSAGEE